MSWDYGIGRRRSVVEEAEEVRAMCVCDRTQYKLRIRGSRTAQASSQQNQSFLFPLFSYHPFNSLIFTKNYFFLFIKLLLSHFF